MNPKPDTSPLEIFSTCPPSSAWPPEEYPERVRQAARWSERGGCSGTLVYSDNNMLDPWLVSQLVVEATEALSPLVAVQPIYMHPYAVAKMVASFAALHGRRLCLNMVCGGFRNDLLALDDRTPHDRRYARLVEYTAIVQRLAEGGPVSFQGEFHRADKLRLAPAVPAALRPRVFVSGSSAAGLAAAETLDATAVKYPCPAAQEEGFPEGVRKRAVRVGIVARRSEEEAWRVAHERFPGDRRGQLTHQLAMKVSDSEWHRQLSAMGTSADSGPYWLFPFENYKTMCPYLVGSYERVAEEIGRYLGLGVSTFILDVPPNEAEFDHTRRAFAAAVEAVAP